MRLLQNAMTYNIFSFTNLLQLFGFTDRNRCILEDFSTYDWILALGSKCIPAVKKESSEDDKNFMLLFITLSPVAKFKMEKFKKTVELLRHQSCLISEMKRVYDDG